MKGDEDLVTYSIPVHDVAKGGRRTGSGDAGGGPCGRIEVLGAREASIHLTDDAVAQRVRGGHP